MVSSSSVDLKASTDKPGAGMRQQATLALAFDLDGPTGDAMLSGALWNKPGYFGLGAYGPHRAVPRILDMLAAHGVRATFFTPAWVVEHWPGLCRRIVAGGHEIGNHGYKHEVFFRLSADEQRTILNKSQDIFEKHVGVRATGFRAPSGDWHRQTAALLAECGFSYSSSLRNGDVPFRHEGHSLIEIPAKSLFDDYTAFAYHRAPNFPSGLDRVAAYTPVFESWGEEIAAAVPEGLTVATIWHPKVIGTPGRALMLEKFIGELVKNPGVRFETCAAIARNWSERNPA